VVTAKREREPPSRRSLLSAAGATAAGAGLLLVGCGRSKSLPARVKKVGGVPKSDIPILEPLLELEYFAIAAYTAGIPLLARGQLPAARRFLYQELSHAGELSGLIRRTTGKAPPPQPSYDLGHPRDSTDVLALLHRIESSQLAAYLDAIPRLSPGAVRAAAAAILSNDAQHVSMLRLLSGSAPIPAAFVSGRE